MSLIYPAGDEQVTPNIGLATWGMDEVLAENMILIDAAIGGPTDSIKINGSVVPATNFINSASVTFSVVGSNVSATATSPVFNVLAYGADPTGVSDSTTAFNNALTAAYTAGGGTIFFPVGTYLIAGQINIPNDGSTTFNNSPLQPSFRITGAASSGGLVPGGGSTPVPWDGSIADGGSILNMTHNSVTAKIATFGSGMLEINHLTLADNSTDTALFFFTSNTTVNIHDVTFLGTTVGAATTNDAIWFGNDYNTASGSFNAPYQGYGSIVTHCYFQNIKRAVFIQCFGNSIVFTENTVWSSCGNTTGGAIEVGPATAGGAEANYIAGNLIECSHYKYGIWNHGTATLNKYIGNDVWDTGSNFTAAIQLDSGGNIVVGGFPNGLPAQYVAGVGVPTSTYMGMGGKLTVPNGQILGWQDSGISRLSATSFALGNGTQGDFTGSLTLYNATLDNATPAQSNSPTLVAKGTAQVSGGNNPSTPVNTTGATLLVAVLGGYSSSHPTISDSAGNSWNYLTGQQTNGGWAIIAYAYGITTNASHTFTVSHPAGDFNTPWAVVYAFSGTLTTSAVYDTSSGKVNQSSPAQPGSITPTAGDILISGIMEAGTVTAASINDSFTTANVVNTGTNYNGSTSYLLNASGSAINPTWTYDGGAVSSIVIAAFKAAVGIINKNSPILTLQGTVWDSAGPSSIADVWTVQGVISNVIDGTSTLTIAHTGSTGNASVSLPSLAIPSGGELAWNADSGISRLGAASLAIGNGTASNTTGNLSLNRIDKAGADFAGQATVTAGNTTQAVTFAANYAGTGQPVIVLTPTSDPLAAGLPVGYWVTYSGGAGAWTGFTVNIQTALAGNVTFNYCVVGVA